MRKITVNGNIENYGKHLHLQAIINGHETACDHFQNNCCGIISLRPKKKKYLVFHYSAKIIYVCKCEFRGVNNGKKCRGYF